MVIVTCEDNRRYVVVPEDEHLFAGAPAGRVMVGAATSIPDVRHAREEQLGRFHFGCQWLRGPGRVDEMYRTLGTWEIIRVKFVADERTRG